MSNNKSNVSDFVFWPIYLVLLTISAITPYYFALVNDLEIGRFLGICGLVAAMGSKESLRKSLSHSNKKNWLYFLSIYVSGVLGAVLMGVFYMILQYRGVGMLLSWILSIVLTVVVAVIIAVLILYFANVFTKNDSHSDTNEAPSEQEIKENLIDSNDSDSLQDTYAENDALNTNNDNVNFVQEKDGSQLESLIEVEEKEDEQCIEEDVVEKDNTQRNAISNQEPDSRINNLNEKNKKTETKKLLKSSFIKYACSLIAFALVLFGIYYFTKPYYQKTKFEKAAALIDEGNIDKGEPMLESLAKSGYTDAETKYGIMLINGELQKEDVKQGAFYLKKAAVKGDTLAQINLSHYYSRFENNMPKASYWAIEALNNGSKDVLFDLVVIYISSYFQDYNKALFYAKMIPDDDFNKEYAMGLAYNCPSSPNYSMAYYWWKKGAEKDNAGCLDNLGYLYYNGYGTKKDSQKALYYFEKVLEIDPDDEYALHLMGKIYFELGNIDNAKIFYHKAADLGNESAQEELSRLELTGTIYE